MQRIIETALFIPRDSSFLATGNSNIAKRHAIVTGIKKGRAKYNPPIIRNALNKRRFIFLNFNIAMRYMLV
ncbi:hypothetical protein MYP_212 [Sporocytophaga myxococcoides]|uniref:Uncharacterized protein n=1 Tax=Sporocytophaga myxococcoides TaxID=153721 RepID=A0A098L8U3_9BACT|nr:hypothetical protein MYP_212 [Sporocytophaga myxococcoides]